MAIVWLMCASVVLVSLLSFVGLLSLSLRREQLNRLLYIFIAFASGSMLAAAFLDLLPESIESIGASALPVSLAGLILFFIMEKFIHWHHCGKEECHVKPVGYLNLLGDGVHNFMDGVVIAGAYLADVRVGLLTTFAIAIHEIPQEFGDFAVLLHAGFSVRRALFYNFISATAAIAGGFAGLLFLSSVESYIPVIVAAAAGGFIYMSAADLIPELQKERERKRMLQQTVALLAGILIVSGMMSILPG